MTLYISQQIGKVIRNLRKSKGLTQEDLAHRIGSAFSYVGRLERGESNMTLETMEKVAVALDMNFFQLIAYAAQNDDDLTHEVLGLLREQDQETKERMVIIIRNILEMAQKNGE